MRSVPSRRVLVAGAAIGGLYVLTRLALLWRFPPFYDEGLYAGWAHAGFVDRDELFVALANGKQPMLAWLGAALVALGIEPLTAVRLVSGVAGLVTLVMMGLIGSRLGGLRVGIAAAAVGAFLPYLFVHNAIGIMEPLVAAAAMTALYLQLRLADHPSLELGVLLGIVFAVALLTKETGKFALALLPLSLLCFRWDGPAVGKRLAQWLGCAAVALTLAWLGFSVLRLSDLYDDMGHVAAAIGVHNAYGDALRHPLRYLEQNAPLLRVLVDYLTVPLALAAVLGAGLAARAKPRLAGVLVGWAIVPLFGALLLAIGPYPRYILVAVPPIGILAGYGAVRVLETVGRGRGRDRLVAAGALAAVLVVPGAVFDARVLGNPSTARYPGADDWQFATGWTAGRAWLDASAELERRADGPTVVQLKDIDSPALRLSLLDRPEIEIVVGDQSGGAAARFAIENGSRWARTNGLVEMRPVWEVRRPRDGTPLRLLERGIAWEGGFYTTPDLLRAGLGGSDAQFDAFVAAHPEVQAWYAAWHD